MNKESVSYSLQLYSLQWSIYLHLVVICLHKPSGLRKIYHSYAYGIQLGIV